MITGGYSAPATVCAFGLPRYTPTDFPPCSPTTAAEAFGDRGEGLVPGGLGQRAVAADQGPRQSVGVVVELGEARALRADETLAEHVVAVAAGAGEPAVGDRQRQAAGGLAQGADPKGCLGHARSCAEIDDSQNSSRTFPANELAISGCSYTLGSSVPM